MSDPRPFVILGAQGHAAVVIELIHSLGGTVAGCVGPPQETPFGLPLLGEDDWLKDREGEFQLANGIGGIGDNAIRARVFERLEAQGFAFPKLIHPRATVSTSAIVGDGVQVMRGAIVQARTRIGANAIVNTGAIVDHDCVLGAHSHVAPGATLSGGVTLGEAGHIGTGATVIQNIAIGDRAIIGAGAVVTANVPGGVTVIGVPARQK